MPFWAPGWATLYGGYVVWICSLLYGLCALLLALYGLNSLLLTVLYLWPRRPPPAPPVKRTGGEGKGAPVEEEEPPLQPSPGRLRPMPRIGWHRQRSEGEGWGGGT